MPHYFIKSAGTGDEPPPADWYRWGKNRDSFGDPTMFPMRPRVGPRDRLVFYAVGSARQFQKPRIFAVAEVTSEPEPSGHDRWPWQVHTQMLVPGPRLPYCPTLYQIDVEQKSLQRKSHISITPEQGEAAMRRIAHAAEEYGSLGRCYRGPGPPADFVIPRP